MKLKSVKKGIYYLNMHNTDLKTETVYLNEKRILKQKEELIIMLISYIHSVLNSKGGNYPKYPT